MSFNQKRRLKRPELPLTQEFGIGTVVRSRTGRSRGRIFAVTGMFTDKYGKLFAYVCDGDKRTVEKPKLKAASHLEVVAENSFDKLTNEDVKQLILNNQ